MLGLLLSEVLDCSLILLVSLSQGAINPEPDSSSVDALPASDLLTQMENLWQTSPSLNDCRYLPDIDIKTSKQRSKAGLPPNSLVSPNIGE